MAKFYNKTAHAVPVTLSATESIIVGARLYVDIDGPVTASLMQHIRSGTLVLIPQDTAEKPEAAAEEDSNKSIRAPVVISLDGYNSEKKDETKSSTDLPESKTSAIDKDQKSTKKK